MALLRIGHGGKQKRKDAKVEENMRSKASTLGKKNHGPQEAAKDAGEDYRHGGIPCMYMAHGPVVVELLDISTH